MKIDVRLFGPEPGDYLPDPIPMHLPFDGCTFVVPADPNRRCPNPDCDHPPGGWRVAGSTQTIGHSTIEAKAVCLSCRLGVGLLVASFVTMWGLDEDQRVQQRCRVY